MSAGGLQLVEAVRWITVNVVGNDSTADALPSTLRPLIAREMVANDFMGWPDVETADAHLDEFKWETA